MPLLCRVAQGVPGRVGSAECMGALGVGSRAQGNWSRSVARQSMRPEPLLIEKTLDQYHCSIAHKSAARGQAPRAFSVSTSGGQSGHLSHPDRRGQLAAARRYSRLINKSVGIDKSYARAKLVKV